MAKVTPVLWEHKLKKDGRAPIRLRFSDARRDLYASLRVAVHPRDWNDRQRRVRRSHPDADEINSLIAGQLAAAEKVRLNLLADGKVVTAEAVRDALKPKRGGVRPSCFLAFVESFLGELERAGKIARVRREQVVVNKLREYAAPKGGPLPFESITPTLLRGFEGWLVSKKKNKASTVHANVGTIKNHYRRAIREGLVPRESDPFFAYTPPRVDSAERGKLSDKDLAAIEALDLGGHGPSAPLIARVQDAFLFSLYAAGARFGDVARLRRRNVVDDGDALRLSYAAGKTGKHTSVLLPTPAVSLLTPYLLRLDASPKQPDDFLFPILTAAPNGRAYDLATAKGEHRAVSSQNALHNKYLKEIASRAGVSCTLSFHVARHSFADLARRRGWSVYQIRQALRHSSLAITERYLAGSDSDALDKGMATLFNTDETPTEAEASDE